MSKSGIHIKPSKKGTFTAAAKKRGKGVQEFARQVMANKENYSPAMVKKANFARNAAKWKHESGGRVDAGYQELGGVHSMRPLPGHQVPVGNAFTATPGHQYPFYERDMRPLPQKAMYGADIEPFVYHGYSENTPMGDGIRTNWHEPKKKFSAAVGIQIPGQTPISPLPTAQPYQEKVKYDKGNPYVDSNFLNDMAREYSPAEIAKANPIATAAGVMPNNAYNSGVYNRQLPLPPIQQIYGQPGLNEAPDKEYIPQETLTPGQMAQRQGLAPDPTQFRDDTQNQLQYTYDTNAKARKKYDKSLNDMDKKSKDKSWIAPVAMTAAAFINSNIKRGPGRQYYTQYDEPYYNPYPTGTGSQAIYNQGGFVNSNAVDFPYKSGITFQDGGGIPRPTSQDSAKLYNAQINLNKFYEEEVKKGRLKKEPSTPLSKDDFSDDGLFSNIPDELSKENLDYYRERIAHREKYGENYDDKNFNNLFNLSPKQLKNLEYEGLKRTKSGNKYQQYYRDVITPMQNLAAPFAMYDSRIHPQSTLSYQPSLRDYPGGAVRVFDYDPLAIKPYSMRTPEEKAQWDKLYGPKTSKKIVSETSKKETPKSQPTAKETTIKPSNVLSTVPYNLESPSVNAGMPFKQRSLQQPATNYSVTFRDEKEPSKQRTQYFPNLESWRDFTNDSGYLSREESGDGRSASALGYSQFKHGGEIMNVASPQFPIARMGGNIRRNYMSEYEEGGELQLYDGRTGAQPISENPYAGPMVEFKGPSHEESNNVGTNGIPMSWQGNDVEVEGGETAFKDQTGNFQILGNMKNPMTGRKFKNDGKLLAKQEQKASKRMQKGLDLVNEADMDNPYDMLKFNSGKAKVQGAEKKMQELTALREQMADIQQKKLEVAAALGIEPMEMDKAYFGKMMTAQGGIGLGTKFGDLPTIHYQDLARTAPALDTVYVTGRVPRKGTPPAQQAPSPAQRTFTRNPYPQTASSEAPSYAYRQGRPAPAPTAPQQNAPSSAPTRGVYPTLPSSNGVTNAYQRGRGTYQQPLTPTPVTPAPVATAPVTPAPVTNTSGSSANRSKGVSSPGTGGTPSTSSGLGGRGGEPRKNELLRPSMPKRVEIPYSIGSVTADIPYTPTELVPPSEGEPPYEENPPSQSFPPGYDFSVPPRKTLVSDAEGFNNWNIAPEIFSVLTNQYDPVLMQKYRPELMRPYQMSFQDQLNRNTDTFRSAAKASDWNPSAIASLAAQKYAADQGVLGNEFRTNQEIAANVVNANRQIMNETQKLNLGLADQQYVRQAQARANTRQRDFDALQSASQKRLLHTAAMNKLRTLENMYDYRFDPRYKAMYEGPDAYFRNPVVQNTTPEELKAAVTQKEPKASSKKKFGGSLAKQFKYYKP